MQRHPILLAAVALVAAGCAAISPAPPTPPASSSAAGAPQVICGASPFQLSPSLTCGPAITAALAALAPGHPAIVSEEFRWGGLCPPGAPCAPPLGGDGVVIFEFASGPSRFVYVSVDASGTVSASSPAPYPSGY